MPRWLKLIFGGLAVIAAGFGAAVWLGSVLWSRTTSGQVQTLIEAAAQLQPGKVSFRDFEQIPPPVGRYLRFALREGQPLIGSVRLRQTGELRGIGEPRWIRYQATQFIAAGRGGFVWDADIRMGLMRVRVRDSSVLGQAAGRVSLFSVVTLADERNRAELNSGALHRYLAELVWMPTALLPGQGVDWSPIDANRALATMTDAGTTVSLEFRFKETGEVAGIYTPARYAAIGGRYEPMPWAAHMGRYEERSGMRIPIEAEVEWHLPAGRFSVWKGTVADITFESAR